MVVRSGNLSPLAILANTAAAQVHQKSWLGRSVLTEVVEIIPEICKADSIAASKPFSPEASLIPRKTSPGHIGFGR